MFLQEIFGFLFRAGRKERESHTSQSGEGEITDKLSSCIFFLFHFVNSLTGGVEAPVLMV
jgi:hypothetical protein